MRFLQKLRRPVVDLSIGEVVTLASVLCGCMGATGANIGYYYAKRTGQH